MARLEKDYKLEEIKGVGIRVRDRYTNEKILDIKGARFKK